MAFFFITWVNVDPDLCYNMVSLGHELLPPVAGIVVDS